MLIFIAQVPLDVLVELLLSRYVVCLSVTHVIETVLIWYVVIDHIIPKLHQCKQDMESSRCFLNFFLNSSSEMPATVAILNFRDDLLLL